MATFSTYAEVLTPDHPLMKPGRVKWSLGGLPGIVLADVLGRTGGAYETTTPLSEKFRDCVRAVAELTSDDDLRRIAELPEVPVSLEGCRQLDPPAGIPATPRSEIDSLLRACRGARIEEHALPDGRYARHTWPAADAGPWQSWISAT